LAVPDVTGKIVASVDRYGEAHFYIHMMERFYHEADPFRWSLNSFLRALKEVPQLLQMELQREVGFPEWYAGRREALRAEPLIGFLAQQRDFVVHRGMLLPASRGSIGITEGRGMKMGLSVPINPLFDSDFAMSTYIETLVEGDDFLDLLFEDEESLPCVERIWRLERFEDELTDLAARALLRTGALVNEVVAWLGGEPAELSMQCRHSSDRARIKLYKREQLREWLEQIRRA
jgi:hypothetical protein